MEWIKELIQKEDGTNHDIESSHEVSYGATNAKKRRFSNSLTDSANDDRKRRLFNSASNENGCHSINSTNDENKCHSNNSANCATDENEWRHTIVKHNDSKDKHDIDSQDTVKENQCVPSLNRYKNELKINPLPLSDNDASEKQEISLVKVNNLSIHLFPNNVNYDGDNSQLPDDALNEYWRASNAGLVQENDFLQILDDHYDDDDDDNVGGGDKKRMHEISTKKKSFECFVCKEAFKQEANLRNHEKICRGQGPVEAGKRKCDLCGKVLMKSNFAKHRRRCEVHLGVVREEEESQQPPARVYRGKTKPCPRCGKEMASTNVARHLREACN